MVMKDSFNFFFRAPSNKREKMPKVAKVTREVNPLLQPLTRKQVVKPRRSHGPR